VRRVPFLERPAQEQRVFVVRILSRRNQDHGVKSLPQAQMQSTPRNGADHTQRHTRLTNRCRMRGTASRGRRARSSRFCEVLPGTRAERNRPACKDGTAARGTCADGHRTKTLSDSGWHCRGITTAIESSTNNGCHFGRQTQQASTRWRRCKHIES
jgi:hypothetical protein